MFDINVITHRFISSYPKISGHVVSVGERTVQNVRLHQSPCLCRPGALDINTKLIKRMNTYVYKYIKLISFDRIP